MKRQGLSVQANIAAVKRHIAAALQQSGRDEDRVSIVIVTKRHPVRVIQSVVEAGIQDIGESYVQEALAKQAEWNDPRIRWHFIGHVQSNKCALIAAHFSWVHSVSSVKVALALSQARSSLNDPLNVCIQVNIMQEPQKSGVAVEDLEELAHCVASQPALRLRGLMCVPPRSLAEQVLRQYFDDMVRLKELWTQRGIFMDTLSMGMSQDYELAVRSGSTMVRIGEAIVGSRRFE